MICFISSAVAGANYFSEKISLFLSNGRLHILLVPSFVALQIYTVYNIMLSIAINRCKGNKMDLK
jgi:hypothetical protein